MFNSIVFFLTLQVMKNHQKSLNKKEIELETGFISYNNTVGRLGKREKEGKERKQLAAPREGQ